MNEFSKGDRVDFVDSPVFQFGNQKTFQTGEVIGVIGGPRNGFQVVAVKLDQTGPGFVDDKPRVEYVFPGVESPMRKVSDGEE